MKIRSIGHADVQIYVMESPMARVHPTRVSAVPQGKKAR